MTDDHRIREDLSYVRAVVERASAPGSPAAIYFLWAVISFFGYAIIDFWPNETGLYWMIAGPLGGVLSGVLGARASRRAGYHSEREGLAEMLHWMGLFAAILLLIPLFATDRIASDDLPRLILLVVGLSYWTAGIHLDRRLAPIGAVVAGLYLFTVVARDLAYLWTLTAFGLSASLVVGGILAAARARRAP